MKYPFDDPEKAREAGQKGGIAKAKARRQLTLERVEEELGSLGSLEDAERWLLRLGTWAAGGLLSGAVAGACVRAVDVWLRAHEAKLSRELIEKLRVRLDDLEAQVVKRPKMGALR